MYARNASTGSAVWQTPKQLSTTVDEASIEIINGTIYVSGVNGVLYALNPSTGNILWQFATNNKILSTPIFTKKYVIIYI